jgi:hypothetical protein
LINPELVAKVYTEMLLFVGRREIEGAVKVIWGVDPKHV